MPGLLELTSLTCLDLRNNSLKSLPQDLFVSLTRLRMIELADNKLREISSTISNLKELVLLNLNNNPDLQSLPEDFFSLGSSLTHLFLSRCPKLFALTNNEKGDVSRYVNYFLIRSLKKQHI